MGGSCSRCRAGRRDSSCAPSERRKDAIWPGSEATEPLHTEALADWDEERQEAMQRLRNDFKQRPTVFLINQILLTVQFFKNFEKDRQRIYKLKEEKEDDLNKTLRREKKSVLYLGSPYEVIGESMEYRRSDNDQATLGHDLDYLITHDNVWVRSQLDQAQPPQTAEYQFVMQRLTADGFVRLRQLPESTSQGSCRPDAAAAQTEEKPASADPEDKPAAAQTENQPTAVQTENQPIAAQLDRQQQSQPDVSEPDRGMNPQKNSGKGQAFLDRLERKVKGDPAANIDLSDEEQDQSTNRNMSSASGDNTSGVDLPEATPTHLSSDITATAENGSVKLITGTPPAVGKEPKTDEPSTNPYQTRPAKVHTHQHQHNTTEAVATGPMVPGYFGFPVYPVMPGIPNPYQMNPGENTVLSEPVEASGPMTAPGVPPHFPVAGFPPYMYPSPHMTGWVPNSLTHYPPPQMYPPHMFGMHAYTGYPSPPMPTPHESDTHTPANSQQVQNSLQNSLLKPPSDRRGRRRHRRSLAGGTSDAGSETRRGSAASSRNSVITMTQDSTTTTDDENDAPGRVPRHCFRRVKIRVDDDVEDEDGWAEPRYQIHRFLSAEIFLNHFTDEFGRLARLMERGVWLEPGGRSYLRGPAINCHEELRGKSGLLATARVIPTLLVDSWPAEMTFEWAMRRRPIKFDDRLKIRYVWPPQRVVQSVLQEVGCNLVPQGSELGNGRGLEWEVGFQQAEIKLISSLDHVHIHCWALAKLFYTHFLAEFGCIKERHVRHLMFWQFEQNFRDWRFDSLGDSFIEVIRRLRDSVQGRRLPHYFIVKRNLLDAQSLSSMVSAQEKIQRVMENLLPNVIILMSRLHVRDAAFPAFDWGALYDNLRTTKNEVIMKLIPELLTGEQQKDQRDSLSFNPKLAYGGNEENEDIWDLSNREKAEVRYQRWRQQQQQRQQQRHQGRPSPTSPPASRPLPTFADYSVQLHLLTDDFPFRTCAVLQMFIEHFRRMAERLVQHGSVETAGIYTDHALNLCTLLAEQGGSEEAEQLRHRLHHVQELIAAALPPLPETETVTAVDSDLLGLSGGSSSQDNWTVGHTAGRLVRRNFNNEPGENDADDDKTTTASYFSHNGLSEVNRTNPLVGGVEESCTERSGPLETVTDTSATSNNQGLHNTSPQPAESSGDYDAAELTPSQETELSVPSYPRDDNIHSQHPSLGPREAGGDGQVAAAVEITLEEEDSEAEYEDTAC